MKTQWDYTSLADAYLKRPAYAGKAIDEILKIAAIKKGDYICDVGAGVAHLTLELLDRGMNVKAVEPNDAMRANGIKRTENYKEIEWFEGIGEDTKQPSNVFDMVTFGSSFNVTDRQKALVETKRILKDKGWFVCMWNHRNINDPIQAKIESIIKNNIANYSYGTRREDQTDVINQSNLFDEVISLSNEISHSQSIEDCIEAWKSHGTLQRQSGATFAQIIKEIEDYLRSLNVSSIDVPYTTRIWMAQLK